MSSVDASSSLTFEINGSTEWYINYSNGDLTYDTPITDDVIGYLREQDVTEVMEKVQQLQYVKDRQYRKNISNQFTTS